MTTGRNIISRINHFHIIILVILVIPAIFYRSSLSMIHVWISNETFTHGFLVFPISIWLIWSKRVDILRQSPQPSVSALLILLPALILWYISRLIDVEVTAQFSVIIIIISSIWLLMGREVTSKIYFPLFFLLFAVPFGQVFIPPLMTLTANVTVFLIQLVGIPVYQDGLLFHLPSGSWSVVQECSGVRYLIASTVLGSLYAYMNYTSSRKRAIFIIISMLLPILANSLRAFGIVMLGHYSDMTIAVGADHLLYGWVFFGFIIFLLFYIGGHWSDPVPETETEPKQTVSPAPTNLRYAVTLTLVLALVSLSLNLRNTNNLLPLGSTLDLPDHFSSWSYQPDRSLSWSPVINNPEIKVSRVYQSGNTLIQVDIGYFSNQRDGAEAVSTQNSIASPLGGDWKKIRSSPRETETFSLTETEISFKDSHLLVWSWYQVGNDVTENGYQAKILNAYNQLIHNRNDAAMISIATPASGNPKQDQKILEDFLQAASAILRKTINQKRP